MFVLISFINNLYTSITQSILLNKVDLKNLPEFLFLIF